MTACPLLAMQVARQIAQQASPDQVVLEPGGWAVMIVSILMVCGLTAFCVIRILREKAPSTHHHVPLDIVTSDSEDESA